MPPSITDLFDKGAPALVDFDLCKKCHPRFCFSEFSIPPWLKTYKIAHFQDHHQTWTRTVHKLYHEVLDNETDRLMMSKALDAGESFALLRPAGTNTKSGSDPVAVAAITFANIGSKVIVLLLAANERYRDSGFGTQLLKLAGECLLHRGLQNISMFLLANQQNNEKAWSFYTRRGFLLSSDDIVETIPEFVDHPTLGEFIHADDGELQLLFLKSLEHDFILRPSTFAKAPMLFLLNPTRPMHGEVNDPMIYARFPGDLSLSQCNHCGKDLVLFHHAEVFQEDGGTTAKSSVGIYEGFPKSQFLVSWRSRTEITTGVTILNPIVSMLLAWIQRDSRARIWKERVTLVPPCVMMPLWNMHFLFQRYLQSRMYKDDAFEDIRNATFHPQFDEERFMEHLNVVMDYILDNGDDLFDKPYLVMFGENLNMDWTCFISVNAKAIRVGPAADECDYTLGDEVCGFINYDPNAEDDVFTCTPLNGDDPYLFFLTLAHHALTMDGDVRMSSKSMDDFLIFFNQAPISFGERYEESLNERSSFNGDHFFVQLALPLKYPLRLIPRMEHLSKLAAILFFIDFCVSVAITHDFHWGSKGNLAVIIKPLAESQKFVFRIPSGFPFGESLSQHLSVSKATMNRKDQSFRSKFGSSSRRIVNTCLSSMIVLIDRIACSGEGETRTSRMEYKKFLANRGKGVPELTSLPAPGVRFTDRCHVLNWRPETTVVTKGAIDSNSPDSSDFHGVEVSPTAGPDAILDDARSDGRSSPDSEFEFEDGSTSEDDGPSREDEPIRGRVPQRVPVTASPHSDSSKDDNRSGTEAQVDGVEGLLGLSEVVQGLEPLQVQVPQGNDPHVSQIQAGQLVPLELELSYEGFHEGSDAARPVEEVAQAIHRMGSLPQITHQPQVLETMPHPSKRLRYSNKKPRTNDFVAVGPMVKAVAKARTTRRIATEVLDAVIEKADSASICVNGDACLCPGGSTALIDLEKCAPCSECKLIGHYICLRKRRNLRLCIKCFPVVHRLAQEQARQSLLARKARLEPFHLTPPPELLEVDKFVPPNIASKMANCLDEEMQIRGFLTAREMRAKIAEHNGKLDNLRNDPDSLSQKEQMALKKADVNMTRLCNEWKKCHARLRREYLRDTRCCVKELSYDSKRALFIANMEWEETAVDKETGEEIAVVNKEKLPVRDEWVKKNFQEGTYNYLKKVAHMSVGKFLPVPHAEIMMDTRQVSHYKWSQSIHHPEGRWIVKFSNSDAMEEMKESDLLAAVGEGSMNLAKVFAKGKGGFLPIPVGNSTGARAVEVISNIEILFRQDGRNTCIYSSFASALWFLGIRDVARVVLSRTEDSDGDPLALKRLAMLVHDHPSWLTPKKIKNASTFNLLEHDLSSSLAVVVLKGIPDGASNHAITVHDGLIFDSNEQFAIPLTKSNLDLMCTTDNRKAKYQCISAGYLFTDSRKGKDGIRDSRMEVSRKN